MSHIEKHYGEEMVFVAPEYNRLRRDNFISYVILVAALATMVVGLWAMASVSLGVGALLGVIALVLVFSSLIIILSGRPRLLRLKQIRRSTGELLSELAFYSAGLKDAQSSLTFGNNEWGTFKATRHHSYDGGAWLIESFASESLGGPGRRIFMGVVRLYRVDLPNERNAAMAYSLETVQHLEHATRLIKGEAGFDASMSDIEYARQVQESEDSLADTSSR